MRVDIDLTSDDTPRTIRTLQPVVVIEGDSFRCLLGPDLQERIFGCGDTPQDALADWDKNLKHRLAHAKANDEVAQYVKDSLSNNEE